MKTRIRFIAGAGLTLGALLCAPTAAQAQCPPGQTGNPPYCQTPPGSGGTVIVQVGAEAGGASFFFLQRVYAFRSGSAMIKAVVPGAGRVTVTSTTKLGGKAQTKSATRTTAGPTRITMGVKPSSASLKRLRTGRIIRTRWIVTFTPASGGNVTKRAKATLRQRPFRGQKRDRL